MQAGVKSFSSPRPSSRLGVDVRVRPGRLSRVMTMLRRLDVDRNEAHLSMPNAALGDDGLGKLPDRPPVAAEHRHFQAILVIEMDMQGGDRKVVMMVEGLGE